MKKKYTNNLLIYCYHWQTKTTTAAWRLSECSALVGKRPHCRFYATEEINYQFDEYVQTDRQITGGKSRKIQSQEQDACQHLFIFKLISFLVLDLWTSR